jgi:glycosyltransferase involved in cell wall biosynthesis
MPAAPVPAVLVTGMVPGGASGMRDYGDLVAAELQRAGVRADVAWAVNDGGRLRSTVAATRALLAIARRTERPTTVLWNYAPVPSGYRGLPGPAAFFGLALRLRGIRVVVVLHELAEPWRRQPAATRVRSLAAVLALIWVLLGAHAWVVTTEQRARRLGAVRAALRRPLRFIPVFSNLGETPAPEPQEASDGFVVGVLDYAATYARPDVVIGALRQLQHDGPVTMVLIGSPGPGTPKAARWTDLAAAMGLASVTATGILPAEELGHRLAAMDVIVLPNAQGPASRKGTLAAALAHGRPVVSLDGPMRWQRLVDAGAVLVAPAEAAALAEVLHGLRSDPARRRHLGQTGGAFYAREMALARATAVLKGLLQE